jgi:opacity protein-like surface antigen
MLAHIRRQSALALMVVVLLTAASISARDSTTRSAPATKMDWHKESHQAGGRLGIWSHIGKDAPTSDQTGNFRADLASQSFYLEGTLGYRLHPLLLGEFSLGTVDRGDVTLQDSPNQRIGSLIITSFLLSARIYPIPGGIGSLVPWTSVGGGLYYGRRNVKFTTLGSPYDDNLNEESRTALGYSFSAGIDWVLASSIALEAQVRWLPVEFSKDLALSDDYRALAFTLGIKYLYAK